MRLLSALCLSICSCAAILAQEQEAEKAFLERYEQRITKTHIDGFYIPSDIADAMETLDEAMEEKAKSTYASQQEDYATRGSFFSLGTWLDLNWGLTEGSRIAHHMKELGLNYPDDMRWLLLHCYHRHLHGKPLHVEQLVEELRAKRKKILKKQ